MFGRGRGRGRGGGPGGASDRPMLRDDDGNIVLPTVEGPPPQFPPVQQLPPHVRPDDTDGVLLARKRKLDGAWKKSVFYIPFPQKRSVQGSEPHIQTYSAKKEVVDSGVRKHNLASAMSLTAKYFADELYSSRQKTLSAMMTKSGRSTAALQGQGEDAMDLFEKMLKREAQAKKQDGDGDDDDDNDEKKRRKGGENAEEGGEEGPPEDEDDEVDMEDNDYYQGEHYDDDEDYADDLYDGGGDEPVF